MTTFKTYDLQFLFAFSSVTHPGWVQAWRRHFRGGPEERSADPPRFSHSCHRLQQESQRTEAQNLRLESLFAAGPVSHASQFSITLEKITLKSTGIKNFPFIQICIEKFYHPFSICDICPVIISWTSDAGVLIQIVKMTASILRVT